ncbi:TlpA family protein disulfide reductase [Candidatus Latescibacterota bacterium]
MNKSVLFFIVIITVFLFLSPELEAKNKMIQVGDTFPGIFLKDLKGNDFFLKDYVGEKATKDYGAIIFSLCASYCKPCKKEIPEFGKLMEKYKDKGLGIFLIALEKEEMARKLVSETKTDIPVLLDKYLLVPKLVGNTAIPFTVLIDKKGTVRLINTGFSEKDVDRMMERLEYALSSVLGIEEKLE